MQQAQQAWSKVLNAVRRMGGDATVIFDDLIHSVIDDMGGWVRLCEMYQRKKVLSSVNLKAAMSVIAATHLQPILAGYWAEWQGLTGLEYPSSATAYYGR